jgi:hypothetical protein
MICAHVPIKSAMSWPNSVLLSPYTVFDLSFVFFEYCFNNFVDVSIQSVIFVKNLFLGYKPVLESADENIY